MRQVQQMRQMQQVDVIQALPFTNDGMGWRLFFGQWPMAEASMGRQGWRRRKRVVVSTFSPTRHRRPPKFRAGIMRASMRVLMPKALSSTPSVLCFSAVDAVH